MKRWTPAEEEFLRVNWPNMNLSKLTIALNEKFKTNRTEGAIDNKVDRMKLPKKREYYRKNYENDETKLELEGRIKTIELLRIKNLIKAYSRMKIKVKADGPNAKIVDGTVIFKNKNLITIKTENYPESFKYVDFYTGRAVIM